MKNEENHNTEKEKRNNKPRKERRKSDRRPTNAGNREYKTRRKW